MAWYKLRHQHNGPTLVCEISEEEAARDVDVTVRGSAADWHIIKRDKKKGVRYAYRIFHTDDLDAKLIAEGREPMSDADFHRWQWEQSALVRTGPRPRRRA